MILKMKKISLMKMIITLIMKRLKTIVNLIQIWLTLAQQLLIQNLNFMKTNVKVSFNFIDSNQSETTKQSYSSYLKKLIMKERKMRRKLEEEFENLKKIKIEIEEKIAQQN